MSRAWELRWVRVRECVCVCVCLREGFSERWTDRRRHDLYCPKMPWEMYSDSFDCKWQKFNEGNLRKNGYLLAHKVPLETAKTKGSSNVRLFSFLMSAFRHWSVSLTLKARLPSQAGDTAARSLGLTLWELPYQKGTKGFFSRVPASVPRKDCDWLCSCEEPAPGLRLNAMAKRAGS